MRMNAELTGEKMECRSGAGKRSNMRRTSRCWQKIKSTIREKEEGEKGEEQDESDSSTWQVGQN